MLTRQYCRRIRRSTGSCCLKGWCWSSFGLSWHGPGRRRSKNALMQLKPWSNTLSEATGTVLRYCSSLWTSLLNRRLTHHPWDFTYDASVCSAAVRDWISSPLKRTNSVRTATWIVGCCFDARWFYLLEMVENFTCYRFISSSRYLIRNVKLFTSTNILNSFFIVFFICQDGLVPIATGVRGVPLTLKPGKEHIKINTLQLNRKIAVRHRSALIVA